MSSSVSARARAVSEPEHPGRRLVERRLLRLRRMWSVVGGDGVDGAVGQPALIAAMRRPVRSGGLTLNTGRSRRAARRSA
jgi:hypothetical protein